MIEKKDVTMVFSNGIFQTDHIYGKYQDKLFNIALIIRDAEQFGKPIRKLK